jgi:DNA-binding NarL/FixJ family response regulator
MTFLDEALAAVAGRDVDDFCVLQEIFCQLFAACERAQDISRADQWIRIGEAIAARRNLPAVSAFCRTHYGGVLTAAGRWPEADVALTDAVRLWALGHRTLRGGALARLADLRVRQGRFEEAEQLLEDLDGHEDAARPLAAIQLSKGETSRAKETLERALDQADLTSSAVVPLLMLLVDVHIAAGALDSAENTVQLLIAAADLHPGHYLLACAALARGRLCLATGDGDPRACLREALVGFDRARLPMELAHSRLELANALVDTQPEVAMAEARAALTAFEKLQAGRHADEAAAVLRSLGARPTTGGRGDGMLTKREAEVLELLGHGLSNPEISDRLFISRKTVEHHVGNVLAKLGLRGRAEAAAYATRAKQGGE